MAVKAPSVPNRAVVRAFPAAYATHYHRQGIDIDPELARRQHDAYVHALERSGLRVDRLAADEAFYDCVFVEDTAVVWETAVLITSMAPHREGEQRAIREYFAGTHEIMELPPGAALEGGDVMHTDDETFVGLSSRTNQRGADALSKFLGRSGRTVVPVEVSHALHLKTNMTYIGDGTTVAENCLRIGDALLIPAGHPSTEQISKHFADTHRLRLEVLDISEFEKGGGSLTCLSLLWQH